MNDGWPNIHPIGNNRLPRCVAKRGGSVGLGEIVAQLFHPYADTALRIILLGLAASPAILIGAGYALTRSPYVTGQNLVSPQPVPFSHEHHVGFDGLDCRYCHFGVGERRAGRAFRRPRSA